MADLSKSSQVYLTYSDVKRANPSWSDQMIGDYIAVKEDLFSVSGQGNTLSDRVYLNSLAIEDSEYDISVNAAGIQDNVDAITALTSRVLSQGQQIADVDIGVGSLQSQVDSLSYTVKTPVATYQALPSDDAINCQGTFTVTLPPIASAVKPVTITSTSATITVAGDATIPGATVLASGVSGTWYPARGQWWPI